VTTVGRVVVPLPVTDAGPKLHVLSEGKPEQANVTLPVKFAARPVTLMVAVPLPPGLAMVTVAGGAVARVKLATLTVTAADVEVE